MKDASNQRGPGKGGTAVLWRVGRTWPALPDRDRWKNIIDCLCPMQN